MHFSNFQTICTLKTRANQQLTLIENCIIQNIVFFFVSFYYDFNDLLLYYKISIYGLMCFFLILFVQFVAIAKICLK